MGVGGNFWDFLKPCARFERFGFLRNKWVAVDLSYWIVQHETAIKGYYRNSHIRLTFFRTINLFAKFGAYPIFVLDGTPSPLKSRARIMRFFRSSGIELSELPEAEEGVSVERNRAFNKCVEECVELLAHLGMPMLKAKAEAEALCAELNREGYVDACITADSDAFLYGARCVIKRIQPKSKEPFECYNISDIDTLLGLKRKHLVAVSLLVGNDHDLSDVLGIGIETAVRFVKSFAEDEIFDHLRNLSKEDNLVFCESVASGGEDMSFSGSPKQKVSHCSHCGHPGKKTAHLKFSCEYCKSIPGKTCFQKSVGFKCYCTSCDMTRTAKAKKKDDAWRIAVCRKISSQKKFPNNEILQMYMRNHHGTDHEPCIEWTSPSTDKLLDYLTSHLQWKPSYIQQKLLPLLSTIYLRHSASTPQKNDLLFGQFEFDSIHRVKTIWGHRLFVIKWKKVVTGREDSEEFGANSDECEGFVEYDDDLHVYKEDGECFLLSEEDMELVEKAFPDETCRFVKELELKEQKSKKSKSKSTPEMFKSPGNQSSQIRITEFYSSSKTLTEKEQAKSQKKDSSSSQKRKFLSSAVSKSVRRRLLFS